MSNEVQKNLSEISKEGITPAELTEAKTAINLLQNEKKEAGKNQIDKLTNEYKENIMKGIKTYFTIQVTNLTENTEQETPNQETREEIKKQEIDKLNLEQTTAYIHLIDRANPNGLPEIKKELTNRQNTLQQEATNKAIAEAGKKSLDNFLTATPSKELADKLFGNQGDIYKPAWEALFTKGITSKEIKLNTTESKEQNLIKILGLALPNENITSIKIITAKNDPHYLDGTRYIKVTTDKETHDIMFGPSSDLIHMERSRRIDDGDLMNFQEEFTKGSRAGLIALEKRGASFTFKNMIENNLLDGKELIQKDLIKNINDLYKGKEDSQENGYYDTITDYVTTQTLAHPNDLSLLQSYLKIVDREHVNYLGTDRSHQVANYNKLAKPEIVKLLADQAKAGNVLAQEIQGNILGLQDQLKTDAKGRKEALNGGVDGFFKAFGKQMTGILERFGGKGAVKKFFHSLGMDDFYTKNLKNIDDNINRIYKEKYELNTDQKKSIKEIAESTEFAKTLLPKDTKFSKHLDNFNKEKGKKMSEKLSKNFQHMDPTLIASLISNSSLDSKANGEKLTASDYIIKEGKEFKINSKILDNETAKTYIINRMLSDPSTRKTIEAANQKIDGAITSGETSKTIEFSRSDLGEKGSDTRRQLTIQTEQDIATYVAAYAFAGSKSIDYVITESDLKHPIIEEPKAPVVEAKTETKAETKAETKPNTKKPTETKEKATPTVAQTQEKKAKDI